MTRNYCGAKTRQAGTPCRRPAGWGTDHAGTGKCKLHGGASIARPTKHGLYAKVFKSKMQKKLYQAALDMKDWKDTSAEIAVLRSLVARLVKYLPADDRAAKDILATRGVSEDLRKLLDTLGKNIERRIRADEGLKVKFEVELNFKFIHAVICVVTGEISVRVKDRKVASELTNNIARKLGKVAESFSGDNEAQVRSLLPD